MKKTINDLIKKFDFDFEKIISKIKKENARLVLLQFPDGLKEFATTIVDFLEEKTDAMFLIWLDTCFGACDTPVLSYELKKKIDLIIQFGHNELMPSFN